MTLKWIIETLKKSGINSKQLVIERLENATSYELLELFVDIKNKLTTDMVGEEE